VFSTACVRDSRKAACFVVQGSPHMGGPYATPWQCKYIDLVSSDWRRGFSHADWVSTGLTALHPRLISVPSSPCFTNHMLCANRAAVQELLAVEPLLEIGAGTGYWARALRSAGGNVIALDSHPPAPEVCTAALDAPRMSHVLAVSCRLLTCGCVSHAGCARAKECTQLPDFKVHRRCCIHLAAAQSNACCHLDMQLASERSIRAGCTPLMCMPPMPWQAALNVFHGRTPAVSEVTHGGPHDAASQGDDRALFLCYPPPGDSMGAQSIEAFRCSYVLHLGPRCLRCVVMTGSHPCTADQQLHYRYWCNASSDACAKGACCLDLLANSITEPHAR